MGRQPVDREAVQRGLRAAFAAWKENILRLYLQRFDNPDDVVLAVFSEHPAFLLMLAEGYARTVEALHGTTAVWQLLPGSPGRNKEEPVPLARRLVVDPRKLWYEAQNLMVRVYDREARTLGPEVSIAKGMEGVVGLGLVIHAPGALPRFVDEGGLHFFRTEQTNGPCLVDTSSAPWQSYLPPTGMDRRGNIGQQERRRTYDFARGTLEDARLPGKQYVNVDRLPNALAEVLDLCLSRNLREILES